jgi:acetoin utilization deacetylase AcuC-like enzyme
VLAQVHTSRYLAFLEGAWADWLALEPGNADRQPFPSVWPVRSLRADVEPANFTARLGLYSMDNGSPLSAGTWAAAKAGADAAVSATRLLRAGEHAVFCATRPPGHHAGADFMGGYCFLNNAAVAAQALRTQGCRRVAVLDVDYHHGNGTQSLFYERADVLFVSLHGDPRTEYPFYLGHADETGRGAGEGFNLNLPLPAGSAPRRGSRRWTWRARASPGMVRTLWWSRWGWTPSRAIRSRPLRCRRMIFPAWASGWVAWGCRRSLCWKAAMRPPNWVRTR